MSADVSVHEGGCLCGALRYKVSGDPVSVAICHCVNCRLNTGSAYSLNVIFPAGTLTMSGTPAIYEDKGDTGNVVRRVFCGKCGTPIESQSVYSVPNYVVVKGGTFDDASKFVPEYEVYCASELPWVNDSAKRARFPKTNFEAIDKND